MSSSGGPAYNFEGVGQSLMGGTSQGRVLKTLMSYEMSSHMQVQHYNSGQQKVCKDNKAVKYQQNSLLYINYVTFPQII